MSKFIVKVGDDTHEVERDSIQVPDGHVLMTQEQFNGTIEGRVAKEKRSAEDIEKALKGQLSSDDEFFKSLAEKRGLQLDEELKPVAKIPPEKVQQLYQQWEKEKYEPVVQERDAFKAEAEQGRKNTLLSKITEAARKLGAKDEVLTNPFGNTPSHFVLDAAEQFEWDSERNEWFFKQNGNPAYGEDGAYAGPEKLLGGLRKKDTEHRYFKDARPGSSGYEGPGGGDSKKITRSQFDAMPEAQRHKFFADGGQIVSTE